MLRAIKQKDKGNKEMPRVRKVLVQQIKGTKEIQQRNATCSPLFS